MIAPWWLRLATAVVTLWASWWLMMAVHETGHVLAAWATGGHIHRIDLSPIAFSQTHLATNPEPLLVVWAGPVFGVAAPLLVLATTHLSPVRTRLACCRPLLTFFAGFCLLANGAYLGLGWIDRVGDAGDMMRLGTPLALMIGFGVLCGVAGLILWHRLGPSLGLKRITTPAAVRLQIAEVLTLASGFILAAVLG